ncbi:LLM class flavin-dependent oxidoreductase [Streptosporangium saharense]|uniref:LLM class flavin-dependent oxidoreductase n=1 Tax=Streptosporangium saharense TaxID=1706840 RepID=UPI00331CD657
MPVDFYWRMAMEGDQPSLRRKGVVSRGGFTPGAVGGLAPGLRNGKLDGYSHVDYLAEVAKATEASGFVGALLPSFPHTDDPWAAAAALARETSTYRFMIAFQPGFLHPVQAARMTASLQLATGGRTVYNVISGGGGPQQLWWGDKVEHDDRYVRTSEFLDVLRGVWYATDHSYDHEGRFYRVRGGGLPPALAGQPFPEIFFTGSSKAAIAAAGRHADYYLSWLEPLSSLAAKFEQVREHSAGIGRSPKFAVRLDVLARETEEEAWQEVERGWMRPGPAATPAYVGLGDSVGWQRGQDLGSGGNGSRGGYRVLEISPNVWGGFHVLRAGPAFGLVGDYRQVAARLDELIALGADAFVLGGVPHLEEAYRVGAHVLPLLRGAAVR